MLLLSYISGGIQFLASAAVDSQSKEPASVWNKRACISAYIRYSVDMVSACTRVEYCSDVRLLSAHVFVWESVRTFAGVVRVCSAFVYI